MIRLYRRSWNKPHHTSRPDLRQWPTWWEHNMLQHSCVHRPPALLLPPCRSSEKDLQKQKARHSRRSFVIILLSHSAFPFLSLSVWKISRRWMKHLHQNKQENSCVFGWNLAASFRPRMTHTKPSLSPKCVPVCILCLLSTFLTTIYIFPQKRLQLPSRSLKCRLMVERANAERLSDRLSRQGGGRDSEPCTTCLNTK